GITGPVSVLNSLCGSQSGDQVGYIYPFGFVPLASGNCVLVSPYWANGYAKNAGAVTFVNTSTGITGPVSAANSLAGSHTDDKVGAGYDSVIPLSSGNYVVVSPYWNGTAVNAGAVTFGGTTGVSGVVSATNSLVGSTSGDMVGGQYGDGVTALSNGNYGVFSPNWSNGFAYYSGAATVGNGVTGVKGPVNSSNSAIGDSYYSGLNYFDPVMDNVNNTFFGQFLTDGGGRVRVGSQTTGFARPPGVNAVIINNGD